MTGSEVSNAGAVEAVTPVVAVEAPDADATHEIVLPTVRCANCQAPLSGPFCSVCGQRHEPHIHSLGEFLHEATESITHADSRVWHTIWPLLTKPGFLTREFLEGRRARFLPPFRLYLVLSVVFFLFAASSGHNDTVLDLEKQVDGAKIGNVNIVTAVPKDAKETPTQRADRICKDSNYSGPWANAIAPRLKQGCRNIAIDNGRAASQAMYHNIPRALFVLLPLLGLVMSAMYWRRYYVEHLLFFVHNHAFTFLLFTLYLLAISVFSNAWVFGILTTALVLTVPWYTYRAMLRVYGQGRWVTRAKFSVLAVAYLVCGLLMVVLTSVVTMLTL
ncbi:MAG: DUF3667 domain-containing protein [Gammaproteobacteria bacterium]